MLASVVVTKYLRYATWRGWLSELTVQEVSKLWPFGSIALRPVARHKHQGERGTGPKLLASWWAESREQELVLTSKVLSLSAFAPLGP